MLPRCFLQKRRQSLKRSGCSGWTEKLLQGMLGFCPALCSETEALTPARSVGWDSPQLSSSPVPVLADGSHLSQDSAAIPQGHPNSRACCGISTISRRGANPKALPNKQPALQSPYDSLRPDPRHLPKAEARKPRYRQGLMEAI